MRTKLLRKIRSKYSWTLCKNNDGEVYYIVINKKERGDVVRFDKDFALEYGKYSEEDKKSIKVSDEEFIRRMLLTFLFKPYGFRYADLVYNRFKRHALRHGTQPARSYYENKETCSESS